MDMSTAEFWFNQNKSNFHLFNQIEIKEKNIIDISKTVSYPRVGKKLRPSKSVIKFI
jgi:hypothetical protein